MVVELVPRVPSGPWGAVPPQLAAQVTAGRPSARGARVARAELPDVQGLAWRAVLHPEWS
jgi:hypothetical protein